MQEYFAEELGVCRPASKFVVGGRGVEVSALPVGVVEAALAELRSAGRVDEVSRGGSPRDDWDLGRRGRDRRAPRRTPGAVPEAAPAPRREAAFMRTNPRPGGPDRVKSRTGLMTVKCR
jgi:hypothetical protein